jgi:hypothetical protein
MSEEFFPLRDRPLIESGDGGHERGRTEDDGARLCADVGTEVPPNRRALLASPPILVSLVITKISSS